MQTEKFFQIMKDGTEIAVNRWIPDENQDVKGIVVLSHGMLEHALRYDRIGCLLAEKGFVFSAHDHRGHGKTAFKAVEKKTGTFGLLDNKDGFNKVVGDLEEIITEIKTDYPNKKIILLGHSFGSFVSQSFIERNSNLLNGCILCGSSGPININKLNIGKFIVSIISLFHKPTYKSKFIQNMAFGSYNKKIPEVITGFEWLSANKDNINMYMNDSWCGGTACIGFFRDLFNGLSLIHKSKAMKQISINLPIFIVAGADDPVGNYGKSLLNLVDIYKSNGIKSVSLKLYNGDRHEILNEKDGDNVLSDMIDWIASILD